MNPLALAVGEGLTTIIIKEWLAWVERRNRAAEWKPTEADIADFLSEIDAASPEAIRAKVLAELKLP